MFRFSLNRSSSTKIKNSHRGFTLAEVLVTLAIIAVMAAVLLPALNSQLSKGDTGRLASDLTSIQTAAQAFLSDVHRYPASVTQLTAAPPTNATDLTGATIPSTLIGRWKGPYLTRDVLSATGGGGTIVTAFSTVSSALAITVTGLSTADYTNLEATFDEGAISSSTGSVRQSTTSSSVVLFLALPIQ